MGIFDKLLKGNKQQLEKVGLVSPEPKKIEYKEEPLETISSQEIQGNFPNLTPEQLENAKKAFVESMKRGDILVQAKMHRFFDDSIKQNNIQLTNEDLENTGLIQDDLRAELRGEQPLFLSQCANGYRKFTETFGTIFLKGLLTGSSMRGDRLPTRDGKFIVGDPNFPVAIKPRFYMDTVAKEDEERMEKYNRGNRSIFQTRVGDVSFNYLVKNGISKPVKFAQVYISGLAVGSDKRNVECVLTAYFTLSNSKTFGNPSLKLLPEQQNPASVAMLRRALQTDSQFLLNVFYEFIPEAFEASDKKGGGTFSSTYYPAKGIHTMHILFDVPGMKLVSSENKFEICER